MSFHKELIILQDAIKDTVAQLIKEQGITFKLDEIAQRLKISKKTIYKYFPSKEEIVKSLLKDVQREIFVKESEILNSSSDVLSKIKNKLMIDPKNSDLYTNEVINDLKKFYPELSQYILRLFDDGWQRTYYLFLRGIQEGILRDFDFGLFKTMYIAGVTAITEDNLNYKSRLENVIDILLEGVKKS